MMLSILLLACSGTGVTTDDTSPAADADTDTDADTDADIEAPPIVINEFLAINDTINSDNAGEFDDWVEIYNTGSTIVQFDGLYLSDDDQNPLKWALPSGQGIDGGGHKLFWADDDDGEGTDTGSGVDQGEDHMSFKLSADGEALYLTYSAGGQSVQVDAIEYGKQQPDVSAARVPDGSLDWAYGTPTPEASNG